MSANPVSNPVYVSLEFTPNPNTLKYSVNRELLPRGAVNILSKEDAERKSPLARKLLDVLGVKAVMIGKDFVTVTKGDDGDWDVVHKGCSESIESHLSEGLPAVSEDALGAVSGATGGVGSLATGEAGEIEKRIREILDAEIRPAVAMDGGDIALDRYEAGVAYLHMQGSCAGCPSSTATLKMGIETRLREAIPEVIEVVAV